MSKYTKHIHIIEQSDLFSGIGGQTLLHFLDCLSPRLTQLRRHQMAFGQGEAVTSFGLVLSGGMTGYRLDRLGRRAIIAHIAPGRAFGEILACGDGRPSPVGVEADVDSEVLLFEYSRAMSPCVRLCESHTQFQRNMTQTVARQYFALHDKIFYLLRENARERILAYLGDRCREAGCAASGGPFDIPFDRSGMADYLNLDRSALSRELGRMRSEGIIEFYKSTFKLLNP